MPKKTRLEKLKCLIGWHRWELQGTKRVEWTDKPNSAGPGDGEPLVHYWSAEVSTCSCGAVKTDNLRDHEVNFLLKCVG